MSPLEKLARVLIGVLAELPAGGSSSGHLLEKFRKVADRSHSTYYACLKFAKSRGWIVADGRSYTLNADGSWRTPPIEEQIGEIGRHEFAHVLELRAQRIQQLETRNRRLHASRKAIRAGDGAGPAISALVTIMTDPKLSTRARLQAASGLLEYKTPPDIAESAKVFLASVFSDPEQNVDFRLMATTALRRCEDPRILPPPPARTDNAAVDPVEPPTPLPVLLEERRKRADELQAAMAAELEAERQLLSSSKRSSNGGS